MPRLHLAAGLTVFGLLSVWTGEHLTDDLLKWALAAYLLVWVVFGATAHLVLTDLVVPAGAAAGRALTGPGTGFTDAAAGRAPGVVLLAVVLRTQRQLWPFQFHDGFAVAPPAQAHGPCC